MSACKDAGFSIPGFATVSDARTEEKTTVLRQLAADPAMKATMERFKLCVPVLREMTQAEEQPSMSLISKTLVLGHNANFGTDHIAMRINKYNAISLEATKEIMEMGPYGRANEERTTLVDTLLHELAHCDHHDHDQAFHNRRIELKAFYLSQLRFASACGAGRKATTPWTWSGSFATIARSVKLLYSTLKTAFSATSQNATTRRGKTARTLGTRRGAGAGAGAGKRRRGNRGGQGGSASLKAALARISMGQPRARDAFSQRMHMSRAKQGPTKRATFANPLLVWKLN